MSLAHLILSLIVFVAAVFALPARAQSAEDETCANQVLVVPPSMNDPLYSTWLVDYAKDALTSALQNECWDFVDNETAREELSFVGFDAYNRRIAKQYGPRQIDILKGRVDFNKVLFMEVRKGAQPQLVLRLYSIEANPKAPLKLSRKFLVSITNQDIKSHRSPFLLRWAAFSCRTR